MVGYHITVPGMTPAQLESFVRGCIPSPRELARLASAAGVKKKCKHNPGCQTTLEGLCEMYAQVPTEDLSLRFIKVTDGPQCMQMASGDCDLLKKPLRKFVHEFLQQKLTDAGFKFWTIIR